MVFVMARREAGLVNGGQRRSGGEFEDNYRLKPRDLTENRHTDSLKKGSTYSFSWHDEEGR
jgi:hypothetical protein